ncbi:uncharacterized protein [Centruroides vittatus]|uniref:uncharacterized protein n=1 Tax=Centruroides vittatus TaxID=120091 RepID=UPI0035106766
MRIAVGIAFTLLSAFLCAQSRPNVPNGWKLGRRNRNWLREASWKKRSYVFRPSEVVRECCPSVLEISEPQGGRSVNGILMDLYRDRNSTQKFYETVCHSDVLDKRCNYVREKLRPYSKCVQKYGLSYALVRKHGTDEDWRLDYILIRSGCACELRFETIRRPEEGL